MAPFCDDPLWPKWLFCLWPPRLTAHPETGHQTQTRSGMRIEKLMNLSPLRNTVIHSISTRVQSTERCPHGLRRYSRSRLECQGRGDQGSNLGREVYPHLRRAAIRMLEGEVEHFSDPGENGSFSIAAIRMLEGVVEHSSDPGENGSFSIAAIRMLEGVVEHSFDPGETGSFSIAAIRMLEGVVEHFSDPGETGSFSIAAIRMLEGVVEHSSDPGENGSFSIAAIRMLEGVVEHSFDPGETGSFSIAAIRMLEGVVEHFSDPGETGSFEKTEYIFVGVACFLGEFIFVPAETVLSACSGFISSPSPRVLSVMSVMCPQDGEGPLSERSQLAQLQARALRVVYSRELSSNEQYTLVVTFPVKTFPVETFPLETFPLDTFSVETFSVETFPVESFPLETFSVATFYVESFPVETFPLETFPWIHSP
uniref:Uncharacterized protein n=1 Tax=Timema monikensis TaxID=170555 RepID=A0A7R9E531_9NEOP|nr:unnamed protein product [Timema monikensis]